MNHVQVSGRLTRDPEIKYVGEGRFPILSFNVAVDDGVGRWNRESGKSEYGSGFYQVEAVGQYAEFLGEALARGDEVYVVGSLSQFTTQPRGEGESKTHTRIRATMVQPLVRPKAEGWGAPGIQPPAEPLTDDPWAPPKEDAGGF